jgi:alpha-ribazole phosphatase
MEILAIRHTKVAVEKGVCYGQSNVPLATTCKDEAHGVVCDLKPYNYSSIYSSPLDRCLFLANRIGNRAIQSSALMELDFGQWEMHTWDEIDSPESRYWMDNYILVQTPGGESFMQMTDRVRLFLEKCYIHHKKETIVWVCHAGVIRVLYHLCNQVPLNEVFNISVGYGSLHRFHF